jgi:hypothetical protein
LAVPVGRHYEQRWVQGYYYNPIYTGFYFYPVRFEWRAECGEAG